MISLDCLTFSVKIEISDLLSSDRLCQGRCQDSCPQDPGPYTQLNLNWLQRTVNCQCSVVHFKAMPMPVPETLTLTNVTCQWSVTLKVLLSQESSLMFHWEFHTRSRLQAADSEHCQGQTVPSSLTDRVCRSFNFSSKFCHNTRLSS